MVRTEGIPANDTDFGSGVYCDEGHYLGELVDNLTDGPTYVLDKGEPYGTLGNVAPAQGVDDFQNFMRDSISYWGLRKVYHYTHGVVRQALVRILDGTLQWINI